MEGRSYERSQVFSIMSCPLLEVKTPCSAREQSLASRRCGSECPLMKGTLRLIVLRQAVAPNIADLPPKTSCVLESELNSTRHHSVVCATVDIDAAADVFAAVAQNDHRGPGSLNYYRGSSVACELTSWVIPRLRIILGSRRSHRGHGKSICVWTIKNWIEHPIALHDSFWYRDVLGETTDLLDKQEYSFINKLVSMRRLFRWPECVCQVLDNRLGFGVGRHCSPRYHILHDRIPLLPIHPLACYDL